MGNQKHIIVVEHYDGFLEYLSDEKEEKLSSLGLGLPLEEIAQSLDYRITVLCWDEWLRCETQPDSPFFWVQSPATRPIEPHPFDPVPWSDSVRVKRVRIRTTNPEQWRLFGEDGKFNAHTVGFGSDSDISFLLSYCVNSELEFLFRQDPFDAVIAPMWGGSTYISQMSKATGSTRLPSIPFILVVTDTARNRNIANQEGYWTRPIIVRRQMEDVSLALADLVFVFGERGKEIANQGRLPESSPPVLVPRRVDPALLEKIRNQADQSRNLETKLQFFLYEPQQASSGILSALDATELLSVRGIRLQEPVISAGPSMVFAPMKPHSFAEFWSTRGFVQELILKSQWKWQQEFPDTKESFPVRMYPSFFDPFPNIWDELSRGSFVLLSPAAAEGLAPEQALPPLCRIKNHPEPDQVASALQNILSTNIAELDQFRRDVCRKVWMAHTGATRKNLLHKAVGALQKTLDSQPNHPDLSRVSMMFLDRRTPLRDATSQQTVLPKTQETDETLSVVITCYEMGSMIQETVQSVWKSEHLPDEVWIIDDGSRGTDTLKCLDHLQNEAALKNYPLKFFRQRNQGLASARNQGLELARGEYISFLDGDDLILPSFYGTALNLLKNNPGLGGVASWVLIFGEDTRDGFWNAPQAELPFLYTENTIFVPCMMPTRLLKQLGGYDMRQRYSLEDWELSIRILESGRPIVTIPAYMAKYRVRKNSMLRSATTIQNQIMREQMFSAHKGHISTFATEVAMLLEHRLGIDWTNKL